MYFNENLFLEYLKQNIREVTAKTCIRRIKLLSKVGSLDDPIRMKNIICSYPNSEAFKQLLTNSYDYYVNFKGLRWKRPRFIRAEIPIFLPTETELDQLISKSRLELSVFLQFLRKQLLIVAKLGKPAGVI